MASKIFKLTTKPVSNRRSWRFFSKIVNILVGQDKRTSRTGKCFHRSSTAHETSHQSGSNRISYNRNVSIFNSGIAKIEFFRIHKIYFIYFINLSNKNTLFRKKVFYIVTFGCALPSFCPCFALRATQDILRCKILFFRIKRRMVRKTGLEIKMTLSNRVTILH